MATCVRDGAIKWYLPVWPGVFSTHGPLCSDNETREVLEELAYRLEQSKSSTVCAYQVFPIWMHALVAYYAHPISISTSYKFVAERNIHLCSRCVKQIQQNISEFDEMYPQYTEEEDLMIKEPDC